MTRLARRWSWRVFAVVTAVVVAVLLGGRTATAQSLGDVAREEEARRKTIKGPVKVYTNEDLGEGEARPAAQSASAAPSPGQNAPEATPGQPAAPQPSSEAQPEDVKDEKYWRGRLDEARSELARNQIFAEALQSRINALTADFVNRDDPAQRAQIERDRQMAVVELERVTADVERLNQQIADIQEEARKAGVPPGWLR